ncbi:MAG: amidohydrolase family protein [Lentisphaerae bacterium]|nr:amidohydrolase family protein [Lentisphaerota bacterium]
MEYFAVNGVIGRSAYAPRVDFPEVADLLEHMDYLGVDRMLVEARSALEYSPILGNQKLLEQIAAHCDRLKPVFVITPADFYETGTLDWLKAQAAAGNRAFRVNPLKSRFPLRQIERLLAELAVYKPLLLLTYSLFGANELDFRDLEELARKFPTVNFLLTRQMWDGFGRVLDLMWRLPNIYLDISWLHMRDAIELIRDEYGAQRLVFGLGFKSHYGAAIGALAHSSLSEAEIEAVAHGNLERLLGLEPLPNKLAPEHPLLEQKPLWKSFREGGRLEGVQTYDAHSHDGPFTRGWVLRDLGVPGKHLDRIMEHVDNNGIEQIVMVGESALFSDPVAGNLEFERIAKKYRGRLHGYFVFNPYFKEEITEAMLDEFFSRDFFVGFKVLPAYWQININDPGFTLMWEYAEKHHLPILQHVGNDPHNTPLMLIDVAGRYPNAKFLLGHAGGGAAGRLEAEELALRFPNVYLELCGTFCSERSVLESMQVLGNRCFIFGSDTAGHNQSYELAALLSIPLPDKQLIPILGENFDKILKDRI